MSPVLPAQRDAWKPITALRRDHARPSRTMQRPRPARSSVRSAHSGTRLVTRTGRPAGLPSDMLLRVGPEVGLDVHQGRLVEGGDALEQQAHAVPVRRP